MTFLFEDAVGHLSAVEIIWLASALWGIRLSLINGWEAWQDIRALEVYPSGDVAQIVEIIANGNLRRESVRLVVYVLFGTVGVIAGFAPYAGRVTLLGAVISGALVVASLALTLNSQLDRRDRVLIQKLIGVR